MYSNQSCLGKVLLMSPIIIIQVLLVFALYGYTRYFLLTISSTFWKATLTIIIGTLVKLFETHYFLCAFTNPGSVDSSWSERNFEKAAPSVNSKMPPLFDDYPSLSPKNPKRYEFCNNCCLVKPERTHHCSACNKCYLKMEHHCLWVGNCIGFYNHKYFLCTLFYGWLLSGFISGTCAKQVIVSFKTTMETGAHNWPFAAIFITCVFGFSFFMTTTIMLIEYVKLAVNNLTSIEAHTYTTKV